MHLKSIALQGFKTFAARTTLELRPGITAVVGPNGSGKSNIADAVRWALGETNLRHVRCRTTEELIFAGNARRSSLGFAEVSLVFANEGGWLGLPFSEVRVTRRANRSGENEYLLNGARVRLRDIVDLLAGASIHAGGHVVVSQGLVDAVLALRPEERRPLIENLAGLKQYYLRRDEAENRLLATESNLVHVDAMVAELAPQLAALQAQAEALRGYRAAEEELRHLQRLTFGSQAARLVARLDAATTVANAGELELASAREEARRLRLEDDRLLSALAEGRRLCDELRGQVDVATRLLEAARRDRDVAAARSSSAAERAALAAAERLRLTDMRETERTALDAASAEASALRIGVAQAEAALEEYRRRAADLTRSRDQALLAARQAQAKHADAVRVAARLAESLTAARAQIERLDGDVDRHQAALAAAIAASRDARDACRLAQERLDGLGLAEEAARQAARDMRNQLAAARAAAEKVLADCRQATRAAEQLSARQSVLREWLSGMDRYGAAVQALAPSPGAAGIVSQMLRIDPPWHAAIALALGARYDAVLAADPQALFAVWQSQGGGRGRVYVVPLAGGPRQVPSASDSGPCLPAPGRRPNPGPAETLATLCERGVLAEAEVLGWASQVCDPSSGALDRGVLDLDRMLLVTTPAVALRCAPHVVALGIAVVSCHPALAVLADGSIAFGVDERTAESIERGAELEALDQALAQARAAEETLVTRSTAARQSLQSLEEQADAARTAAAQAESAAARARDECRFQERLVSQAAGTESTLGPLITRCRRELAERNGRLAEDERRLALARHAAEQSRAVADAASAAARQAEELLIAALAARRDDESALALARDRGRAASRLVDDQLQRLRRLEAELARHTEQDAATSAAIADLTRVCDEAVARESAAAAELERLDALMRPAMERLRADESAHRGLRDGLRGASDRLARAEVAHERARREADNHTRDLEILRAQVSAELGCAIDDLPTASPPSGAVSRIKVLRAEMQAIGPINARAEDDLRSTSERLEFLQAQSSDLRSGVAHLRAMISDANATVRERFTETVEALDRQFSQFFARLFGGGRCRLVPEYDANGLPTGVEVHAQPPGKRTRDLALLSGGERALIAMALLFAMLRVRPVPFCLLDEVEAALDEANTGRFGAILRELSDSTQFILVTHNRGTMLHADRLYGITMSETGISTAASIVLSGLAEVIAEPDGAVLVP